MGLVLVAACVIEPDGPDQAPALDGFRAVVVLFDPWFWAAVRNSVVVALVTAAGSLLLGTMLGGVISGRSYWLRAPLAHLLLAGAAVPPLIFALGLKTLLGSDVLGARPLLSGLIGESRGPDWLCLTWANLARGVPLVALATGQALRRIEPFWEASGMALGAPSRKIWSGLTRPLIRGAVARATAAVFGLTLLEPAAPLVLTLRRTVGFQLCEGVRQGDPVRTAVLVLFCGLIVGLTRWLAARGGRDLRSLPVRQRPRSASWRRAILLLVILAAGLALVWLPVCALALSWLRPETLTGDATRLGLQFVHLLMGDVATRRVLVDSVLLGGGSACLALLLAWLTLPVARAGPTGISPWESAAMLFSVPCAVALVFLRLPVEAIIGWGGPAWLRVVGRFFSPLLNPWVVLTLVLALAWTPVLRASLNEAARRWPKELRDAALAVGAAGRWAGWRLAVPVVAPVVLRGWLTAAVCAGCDASVSVLLSLTDRPLPIGPSIAYFQHDPENFPRSFALAVLVAVAVAAASSGGLAAADRQRGSSSP